MVLLGFWRRESFWVLEVFSTWVHHHSGRDFRVQEELKENLTVRVSIYEAEFQRIARSLWRKEIPHQVLCNVPSNTLKTPHHETHLTPATAAPATPATPARSLRMSPWKSKRFGPQLSLTCELFFSLYLSYMQVVQKISVVNPCDTDSAFLAIFDTLLQHLSHLLALKMWFWVCTSNKLYLCHYVMAVSSNLLGWFASTAPRLQRLEAVLQRSILGPNGTLVKNCWLISWDYFSTTIDYNQL